MAHGGTKPAVLMMTFGLSEHDDPTLEYCQQNGIACNAFGGESHPPLARLSIPASVLSGIRLELNPSRPQEACFLLFPLGGRVIFHISYFIFGPDLLPLPPLLSHAYLPCSFLPARVHALTHSRRRHPVCL